ncbi:Photosystem II 10 kDa polypeptide chloroplastic [Bienertia sinuspersici]
MLSLKEGNKLQWGAQTKITSEFGVNKSTISRLCKKVENQRARGESIDVRNKKKGVCGRKPYYANTDEWLESAPLHLRGSYRAYAGALIFSRMHVKRLLKKGLLRAHTSTSGKSSISNALLVTFWLKMLLIIAYL